MNNQMWQWEPWFAWYPVKVNGKWKWLKMIQRRNVWKTKGDIIHESYIGYEYK